MWCDSVDPSSVTMPGNPVQRLTVLQSHLAGTRSKMSKPLLSTHVLDTAFGKPAVGLQVKLFKLEGEEWTLMHEGLTSADGRYASFVTSDDFSAGTYKLRFDTGRHYRGRNLESLYPFVEIVFTTKENEHYHIPLLLTPFGYSTYRGT